MIDLEVASVEPDFGFTDDVRYFEDGVVLYIEFEDYKMPYDTGKNAFHYEPRNN